MVEEKLMCEAGYREQAGDIETLNFWLSDLECPPGKVYG